MPPEELPVEDEAIRQSLEKEFEEMEAFMDKWLTTEDRKVIRDEEIAGKLDDFIKRCKKQTKKADETRKAEVKPYNDYVSKVNAEYKSKFAGRFDAGIKILSARLTDFLQWKRKIAEEKAAEERKKAEEARKAEAEARKKAEEEESMEALKLAEEAEGRRKAQEKATREQEKKAKEGVKGEHSERSTGLRRTKTAKITDLEAALFHFSDNQTVIDAVERAANDLARAVPITKAKDGMDLAPGVVLVITETA
jgi:hypothetical protein